jgi:V/A-type H+-transporting ATPase subunit A
MLDEVELGPQALPGEVVAIRDDLATVQAYEHTGGLASGAAVACRGEPLSAPLGPHLLGGVFDGLLRPLPVPGGGSGLLAAARAMAGSGPSPLPSPWAPRSPRARRSAPWTVPAPSRTWC